MVGGSDEVGQEQAGTWLAVMDAARYVGVSERTLRRHIRQGRYQTQREGRRVRVFVPGADAGSVAPTSKEPPDFTGVLQTALQALANALEAERARADRLEARLRAVEDARWALDGPPIPATPARARRGRGA